MNIYQRALQFYLDSGIYFNDEMWDFFEYFNHKGKCEGRKYCFESEIYRNHIKKSSQFAFHQVTVKLSDTQIEKYFTKHYSNHQLFAIIFSHWFELSQKQISQIKNMRNKYKCLGMLNYFLCNPTMEEYPLEESYVNTNLNQKYYVFDKDTKKGIAVCSIVYDYSGAYLETYLVNEELGLKFKVDEG